MSRGKVYLVGAGPGDPGLFTLKGKEVLGKAEVVIYDFLANEELLRFAPPEAERIYVGKQGGAHTLSQEEINRLLLEKGRQHVVVRLKGGDPFVFGRGGEEAQELAAAGIDFEVVPGVTAAVAVPAYAGIPLSHRDFTASMAFITGHERADATESKIDWSKLATAVGTLVFFMGVKNLPRIADALISHGRDPDTPVAVIRWGTTPQQRTVTAPLAKIAKEVNEAGLRPPALIVVGEVVRLRDRLNWFEKRPLFGRTVMVTRAREQASEFKAILHDLGARCVEFPTIRVVPPEDWGPLDEAVRRLADYHWVLFTSVNGVRFFLERLFRSGKDVRALSHVRLAAIGPKTAEALEEKGLKPDVVPREYRAESLLEAMEGRRMEGMRILLPRAKKAREILPDTLRKRGAVVDVVPAYETVLPEERSDRMAEMFRRGEIDYVTFTSSSTVTNFVEVFRGRDLSRLLSKTTVACIGPVTADTARNCGLEPEIVAEEYTIPGLVDAICRHAAE